MKAKYWFSFLFFVQVVLGSNLKAQENKVSSSENSNWRDQALSQITTQFPWLLQNQNGLLLQSERRSEIGSHFLFAQMHQGILVYGGDVKINLSLSGKVLSVFSNLKPIYELLPTNTLAVGSNQDKKAYLLIGSEWLPCIVKVEPNNNRELVENVYNRDNALIQSRMLDLFARKDSLVPSKVFNPDPLTTAQKTYGQDGIYKNNGGADASELNAERKVKNITLGFSNDTFYASSSFAVIKDLESPTQTVFQSTSANFNFTRSQSEFREMNCLYHIEQLRTYLTSINLPLTGMKPLLVDPTAYQGQDQSRFSFTDKGEPALFFGTGGVPDAEDADVITHEYTHGISNFIAPNTTSGSERLAVEEANCDFMACQYSKAISAYNWRWVFNWDGHNEFWSGRNANSKNVYPTDLSSSDYYQSSLIWSSMLNDISEDIGREVTTRLLLTSMYSYNNNQTMQEMANLLAEADSIVYGYEHIPALTTRFTERGFSIRTGLLETFEKIVGLQVINSEEFAKGTGSLKVSMASNQKIKAVLYNIMGETIQAESKFVLEYNLAPTNLNPGVYFLHVSDEKGRTQVLKLVRL
ncbi:MAG: hypothetical protein CFE21_12565 [Bacteroidetes bacterium B1(2017)]|nr:MAG: hypothetical protein CFE21_12565 [Bacteroidetes bacterium B1(2017)]